MLRRLKHVIITIFLLNLFLLVTLSLSIVLRKILCRPLKGMLLLVFSRYVQGTQGTRGWNGAARGSRWLRALFLALCEYPCTSRPAAFLRYALQVRSVLIKWFCQTFRSVCWQLHGGFVIRQLPKWSLRYYFSDLREVLYTEWNFTQNTVWSWMKLRGTGRNVVLKQKDFQSLSLKAISDFAVPSRQLQEAPLALLCGCDVWEWISSFCIWNLC